jgi:hypothetical protein
MEFMERFFYFEAGNTFPSFSTKLIQPNIKPKKRMI